MENATTFHELGKNDVSVYARNEIQSGKLMSGRAIYNLGEHRFSFVENPPRTRRSKLIRASGHASLRRRHDGSYSINIVFKRDEKYVRDSLLSEVRALSQAATDDKEDDNEQ